MINAMKSMKYLVMASLLAIAGVFVSCSDDDPKVITEQDPGEPISYSGEENFVSDSLLSDATMNGYNPEVNIVDAQGRNLLNRITPGCVRGNDFYFQMDGDSTKYRIGDQLPCCSTRILFSPYSVGNEFYDMNYIDLGRCSTDRKLTFHWPEKKLTVYLRTSFKEEKNVLRPHDENPRLNMCNVYTYGLYVNGVGRPNLTVKVNDDGNVTVL